MIIHDIREKGKKFFVPALIICLSSGAYAAGTRLKTEHPIGAAVTESLPIPVSESPPAKVPALKSPPTTSAKTSGTFVAARGGKAYYPLGCPAAKRIAEKNKIWFDTKLEAEKAGFRPAANCKGFK